MSFYYLDYYFPDLRLAVELDSELHDQQKDLIRDSYLAKLGITVWRMSNLNKPQVQRTEFPKLSAHMRAKGVVPRILFDFQKDFHVAYQDILSRNKTPILCGGTGLYIESVLKGYELKEVPKNPTLRESLQSKTLDELTTILSKYKNLHNTTDTDSKKRAIRAIEIAAFQQEQKATTQSYEPVVSLIIGVSIDRENRRNKISSRLKARIDEGMIDEVKKIISLGVAPEDLIYYGLEYKFVTLYVTGQITYQEMYDKLEIAIHQFAKRQMTWFRGMERRGIEINWIDALLPMDEKVDRAMQLISKHI